MRTVVDTMDEPALAHYVAGWPKAQDVGFVAGVFVVVVASPSAPVPPLPVEG